MVEGDLRSALRRTRTVASLLAAPALAVVAAVGCGSGDGQRAAERDRSVCAQAVLGDWADGSFDRRHPADCYLAAIDSLPEDVRTYTSAEDDLTRALQAATSAPAAGEDGPRQAPVRRYLTAAAAGAAEPPRASSLRSPPAPLALLAALAAAVVGGGTALVLVRRLGRGR